MEYAMQSPTVQKSLPDLASLHTTLGFDGFLASPPPTVTSDAKGIREHLRGYAVQLERHERFTELWKHQYHNQLVNLRQLITAFDTRCEELTQMSNAGYAQLDEVNKQKLGLSEFEDLYYFLACKTRTLYSDLQLRFGSGFVTMDTVLHYRGSSSYAQTPCTVRDIRNFLRAVWFHLLHPVIVRAIESAMNDRKYQALKAKPLLPFFNSGDMTQHELERMSHFQLGLNLDSSMIGSMFEHLDDVSTMSVPALLMKVSQKGFPARQTEDDRHSTNHKYNPTQASAQAWIDLAGDTDGYVHTNVVDVEDESIPCYERELSGDLRVQPSLEEHVQIARQSPVYERPQVQVNRESIGQSHVSWEAGRPAVNHVRTWLPNVVSRDVRSPLSSIGVNTAAMESQLLQSPRTSRSGHSVPSTPSRHRMPFHGFDEFPHETPAPPPKSPAEFTRAQEMVFERGDPRMHKETSRLQDALQQVESLQRENSQLQERLSMASPSRGLFRRLSKGGTRSPRKSPRRSILHGITK